MVGLAGKYAGFTLGQRQQLEDIYKVCFQESCGAITHHHKLSCSLYAASLAFFLSVTPLCSSLHPLPQDLQDPTSKNSAGAADVATLGDAWLAQAIRDKLIQPIANAESYR